MPDATQPATQPSSAVAAPAAPAPEATPSQAVTNTTPPPAAPTQKPSAVVAEAIQTPPQAATGEASPAKATQAAQPAPVELKVPEGVSLDPRVLNAVKGLGLDGQRSQAIVNLMAGQIQSMAQASSETAIKMVEQWKQTIDGDPTLSDPKAVSAVRGLIDKFGNQGFKEGLQQSGFAYHPDFYRFLHSVASFVKDRLSEDSTLGPKSGGSFADTQEALYRQLYKNSPDMFRKE